jgi:hypothetical protein
MKEITECIGEIGRANSNIFTTLDLTSGFWQMKLDEESQKLATFTIPGKGHGLTRLPGQLSKAHGWVLRDVPNVVVYIDNLLVHMDPH